MRPMFYDFHEDKKAWETEDQYMFGSDILVAPVLEEGARERSVYLPAGAEWIDAYTKQIYSGGQRITVPAPIDVIPIFYKNGAEISIYD